MRSETTRSTPLRPLADSERKEGRPEGAIFTGTHVHPNDLPLALAIDRRCHHHADVDHPHFSIDTKNFATLGGRAEEFRVGNDAEASSQLVWDVDGRLHPEEQPHVELWPSQQLLFPVDVFLQSFPSTPTVRSHQHVAIGLGNPVRELAVPAQVSAYGQVPHRRAAETPL